MTVVLPLREATDPDAGRLRLFTIAWALANIVHLLRHASALTDGPTGSIGLATFVLAALVLLRPSDSRALVAMAVTGATHTALLFPLVVNHAVIMLFVDLTVIAAWIRARAWRSSRSPGWFSPVEPFLRLALVAAYASAAIAKLNSGFFSLPNSCAIALYEGASAGFPWETLLPGIWFAYVVAGIELAIPALFLRARTRAYGVLLALAFHFVIVIGPYSPGLGFTWVLYALLVPFFTTRTVERFAGQLAGVRATVASLHRFAWPAAVLIPLGVSGIVLWGVGARSSVVLRWAVPVSVALVVLMQVAPQIWRDRTAPGIVRPFAIQGLAQFAVAALLLANAASPYLGGRTISAFTMYSNLTTEGGTSNHFFIPRLQIATAQDDLVTVVASDDAYLDTLAEEGVRITWHELRRHLSANSSAAITYLRHGDSFALAAASADPELVSTDPVWHRLVAHRLVPPDGRCLW